MARTKEEILKEMMSELPDSYDKTEGSVLHDILAPVAIVTRERELMDEEIMNNMAFDTASDAMKLILAKDRANIDRKQAGASYGTVTITGDVGTAVEVGTLVASELLNFEVTEEAVLNSEGMTSAKVQCTEVGLKSNIPAGAILDFPVTIAGLQTVTNEEAFDNGYDEESMEDLAERYYLRIQNPGTSGNAAHYKSWALEVEGVGGARVFARTPQRGDVTVYIIDANKQGATDELVETTRRHIDEEKPTPANVYVYGAEEIAIDVSVSVTASGEVLTTDIEAAVAEYLKEIAFEQEYVSYARIGSVLLGIPNVLDISNLRLNGGTSNIAISQTQVAVMGGVTID